MLRNLLGFLVPSMASRSRKPRRRVRAAEKIGGANFAPSDADGTVGGDPKVLLADLVGDKGGAVTAQIADILGRCSCLEIYRANQMLKLPKDGNIVLQLMTAAEEGRGWMHEQSADLLLWGELRDDQVRLRFLPMLPSADNLPGAVGLGDTLELPATIDTALEPAIHAGVLAAVGPTFQGLKARVAEGLGQALSSLKEMLQSQPAELSADQYATFLTTLGNAFAAHYRLGGGAKRLNNAGALYRKALKLLSVDNSPEAWAVAQSHYAAVLKAQGEGKDEEATDALKKAAVAYQKITETLSRVAHPFDWALAHINHGLVLYRLSGRSGRAAYLQEATKAFEEALTVYTKEAMPARWAEVTNQYGVILLAMGEQVSGNATLEQAVKRFRQVLGTRKRDRAPLLWAQTANNLGAACFALAKRNAEAALLREASSCFEGAVEIYAGSGAAKKAEVIRNNLARVERLLSARAG